MRRTLARIAATLTLTALLSTLPACTTPQPGAPTRTPVVTWTDGVAVCMAEDGSTPGQAFPCRWDARYQGNGLGESFTLTHAPDMDATL